MVNLTIDGRAVQAKKGQTILEACDDLGIFVPRLCYHPALKPIGACRICVVDVKPGPPRPLPACATYVAEGQEVVTASPRLHEIRTELMKLVLINHALECPICDKGGECELQDLTHAIGVPEVDLTAIKLGPNHDYVSQLVERHPDRCVTCGRCIRICRDRVGAMAINFTLRGYFTELTSGAVPLDCEFCGSCIDICPVGALINKQFKYRSRAWEVTKTEMACPFCGGGCTYELHVKDGKVMRVFNGGDKVVLCGRGRFGWPVVDAPDRLKTPLIRKDGKLEEATWDEALDLVAAKFKEIIDSQGAGAIYGVGSPRATNEANYLFQKFFRNGLGTNNLDNPSRYTYMRALQGLAAVFGPAQVSGVELDPSRPPAYTSPLTLTQEAQGKGFPFVLGRFADLPQADVALVVGADITPELPPLGWTLLEARERDTFRLILANNRRTKFDRYADLSLRCQPGTERLLVAGIIKALLAAEIDPAIPAAGLDEFKESLKKLTLKDAAKKTGVEEEAIKAAADLLAQAQAPAIIFGTELLAQEKGQDNATALADLFLLVGKPGAPGSAVYPVAEKNNTRGVCELGVLPDFGPGFQPVEKPGATLPEVLALLEKGDPAAPQALYLLGGDLLRFAPNRKQVAKALKKAAFIVVLDAFLTETAKLAHVVLPVAVHAEQEGTFISSDGTLGYLAKILSSNGVKPDCLIINQIGRRLGFALPHGSPRIIFKDLAPAMPLWAGLAPKGSEPQAGFARDLSGRFAAFDLDVSLPGRRPLTLVVGKVLQHSGSYTTRHPCGTLTVTPRAELGMNPGDAQDLGLNEGDAAKVVSSQGEITAPVTLNPDLPPGLVFLPEHFAEPATNALTLNSNLVRVTISKG
jgi:formate dehydrogenase alpha subunit